MSTVLGGGGSGAKKTNPCPRVINQWTKVGGEETRIIQFHGWNINNGVRGPVNNQRSPRNFPYVNIDPLLRIIWHRCHYDWKHFGDCSSRRRGLVCACLQYNNNIICMYRRERKNFPWPDARKIQNVKQLFMRIDMWPAFGWIASDFNTIFYRFLCYAHQQL